MSRKRRRRGAGRPEGFRRPGEPAPRERAEVPADDMDDMDDMEGAPEEDEPTGDGEPAGYADVARSSRRAASGDGGSRSRGAAQRRGEPARPARGRLTQSLRAPSPFPGFWRSIAVGITTVGSSVTLLAVTLLLVPGIWLVLLALGVDHLPPGMLTALALPPIGSLGDIGVGGAIYPLGTGALIFLLVATVVRAVLLALLAGIAVEVLQYRRVSLVGLLRGLQGAPTVLAASVLLVVLIFFSQLVLAQFLGASLGQLMFTVVLIGGLHLLVFVPVAAVSELRPPREILRRAVRAALLPGSRHLVAVLVYFLLATTMIQLPIGDATLTVNPSIRAWAVVLVANLFHVAFLAAFGYRWLVVQDIVPDVPLRFARGTGARRPPPGRRGSAPRGSSRGSGSRGSGSRGSGSRSRPR